MRTGKFGLAALLLTASLAVTGAALSPAFAVPDYPTAAEVSAAKRSVTAKKKMIERLDAIIDELEAEAEELGTVALIKNEEYNQAREAVSQMQAKVDGLGEKADEATHSARRAQRQLAQIAARMYREGTSGSTSLQLFLDPDVGSDLLYKLGAQDIVAQRTDAVYQESLDKQSAADSLVVELSSAQDELEDFEAVAEQAFAEAQTAADAVSATLAENESISAEMLRQLASLRDTAADLERERREGLAAEARQNAVKDAPTAPELYSVGAPNSDKVETAIAFAKAQLGERYVLGGSGPDVWDCSGITMKSYSAAGVYIGWHSATAQFNVLASQKKLVPFQNAKRGDLIWWTRSSSFSGDKYHVGIYLGDGMMLEAPNPARTVRIVPVRYGELFPYAGRPTAPSGN